MNRRDLLKRIGLTLPAIVLPVAALTADEMPKPEAGGMLSRSSPDFYYHGWKLHWRDWIWVQNMDVQVGTWMAYGAPTDQWHLYSSWPGGCGPYMRGHMFDLALRDFQVLPTFTATAKELDQYKIKCLERLKLMIDKVGAPPLHYDFYAREYKNIWTGNE
jgi:hypothetical protein